MKNLIAILLCVVAGPVFAAEPEPVSIGGGKYMMTDHHISIFGSRDGLIVDLIKKAHVFCKAKTGQEAEVISTDGSDAIPAELQYGRVNRAAQGATGTIYFACPGADNTKSATSNG